MMRATMFPTQMHLRRLALWAATPLVLASCQGDLISPDQATGTRDVGGSSNESATGTTGTDLSNRYIIRFQPGTASPAAKAQQLTQDFGGTVLFTYDAIFPGFAATLPSQAVAAIRSNPNVQVVEPDALVTMDATQTLGNAGLWGLDRIDQRTLTAKAPLNNSYIYENTASNVEIYVVDTGILLGHLEFGGRASLFKDYVLDGRTGDCNGHGTFVAAIAAGTNTGVAKGSIVKDARALACDGTGTVSAILAAINDITVQKTTLLVNATGPRLIVGNLSLRGQASSLINDAIDNSVAKGVVWAVSAGNSNTNACNWSPAAALSALTVAASTKTDARATFSNFGTCVDLFAPGDGIYSATNTGTANYATMSGTSAASAFVAGTAAIYLQSHQAASAYEVNTAITSLATTNVITSAGTGTPNRLLYSVIAQASITGPSSSSFPLQVGIGGNGGTGSVTGNGISCSSAGGSTNDCEQYFATGTVVTLTAVPGSNTGVTWGGACLGVTGTSCTVTVDGTTSVIANFSVAKLSVYKSGTGNGSITSSPTGINCGTTCSAQFALNTTVSLTASPSSGSQFVRWSGAPCDGSTSTTCAVPITAYEERSMTAVFQGMTTLTVTKSGTGTGLVTSSPTGISCGTTCSMQVLGGSVVTLTATPDANNRFDGWSGACSEVGTTCTVTMDQAKTANAIFTSTIPYDLTVTMSGNGDGQITSNPAGISCVLASSSIVSGSDCAETYLNKQLVTLTAVSTKSNSLFTGWSGACTGSANTCTVTMDAAKTVGAAFNVMPGIHVANLEFSKVYMSRSWEAYLTVTVHAKTQGGDHTPIDLATVTVTTTGATTGTYTCTTDTTGSCRIGATGLNNKATSITFNVTNITKSGYKYDATANHDIGGAVSDGTTLTVMR